MTLLKSFTAFIVSAAILVPAVSSAGTDDVKQRLDSGKVIVKQTRVKGTPYPKATAMAVIDAPVEKVWKAITDCKTYPETHLRVSKTEVLPPKGGKERCRTWVELPLGFGTLEAVIAASNKVVPGKKWQHRFSLESGDYEKHDGTWTAVPWTEKGRTLVVYEGHIIPKVPIVPPEKMIRSKQDSDLKRALLKLRKVLEK